MVLGDEVLARLLITRSLNSCSRRPKPGVSLTTGTSSAAPKALTMKVDPDFGAQAKRTRMGRLTVCDDDIQTRSAAFPSRAKRSRARILSALFEKVQRHALCRPHAAPSWSVGRLRERARF